MSEPLSMQSPDAAGESVAGLVQADRVHRDVYLSARVYALERERLWKRAWVFLGHDSLVPKAGDYYTAEIAGQSLAMLRQADGTVAVMFNRCAHKGSRLLHERQGSAGKFLRCPYHAWTYKLDGKLMSVPLKNDYEGTGMSASASGQGLAAPGGVRNYKGFVFVRISESGPDFDGYFGSTALATLDNMVARSPLGELEVVGAPLRNVIRCNWKMYLENINDTVHPISTHESAATAAAGIGKSLPEGDAGTSLAMEQLLPFGAGYSFYSDMGAKVLPNGHSVLGTKASIHTGYAPLPEYEAELAALYGADQARALLAFSPQNTVLYPSAAFKTSPSLVRVLRPLGPGRTLVEAWALAPRGAPQRLRQRVASYARLVFSPMSVVAHDDVHLFESQQIGLGSDGNEWVSLHRGHKADEAQTPELALENGNNEIMMRNQYRGWLRLMDPA